MRKLRHFPAGHLLFPLSNPLIDWFLSFLYHLWSSLHVSAGPHLCSLIFSFRNTFKATPDFISLQVGPNFFSFISHNLLTGPTPQTPGWDTVSFPHCPSTGKHLCAKHSVRILGTQFLVQNFILSAQADLDTLPLLSLYMYNPKLVSNSCPWWTFP